MNRQTGIMALRHYFLLLAALAVTQSGLAQVTSDTLRLVGDQFSFTEGPAADRAGNVFFTDQPNNRIWKYGIDSNLSVFMENAGRSNGLYVDREGFLIACADEHNELWRIGMDESLEKLATGYRDSVFNGPNDVWVSPAGLIYFTDPYYQRDYWERTAPDMQAQALYVYHKGQVKRLDDAFKQPNGIIGTPDGKFLYVADIGDSKIYRYRIRRDGSLSDKRLFAPQGSDGMTIDEQGNIYLTGKGVTVYDSDGNQIDHIPVPSGWTANVCFGGPERDFLFITARDKVFTLKMNVKGVK